MFFYYLNLALRSLARHRVLTALMVLAIGLGIGASMTTLTVFHVLSGDPIPEKSERLFYVQLDAASIQNHRPGEEPHFQLTRYDAEQLLNDARGRHQAFMSGTGFVVQHADLEPMLIGGRMTTTDFFALFGVPFRFGTTWSADDDQARARVAVITSDLNERLFDGANSVGQTVVLNQHSFTIIGVIEPWSVKPKFYDLTAGRYDDREQVYVPIRTAIELSFGHHGDMTCWQSASDNSHDPEGQMGLNAPCAWLQYWVELDPSAVNDYRLYLHNYSEQQRAAGRFERPVNIRLRNVRQWLDHNEIVPDDVRLQVWLAFGFLLVCLVNTIGLLLAKFLRRSSEIGVRRALGASRMAIFAQHLMESGVIGLAGGVVGLGLATLGLWLVRSQPAEYAALASLDVSMLLLTFVIALLASLCAGMLPAWRACRITPAIQLKSQ